MLRETSAVPPVEGPFAIDVEHASIIALANESDSARRSAARPVVPFASNPSLSATKAGLIDNTGIATALASKILAAQSAASSGQNQTAINILGAFENQVSALVGTHITRVAPQVLLGDASSLISQMQ